MKQRILSLLLASALVMSGCGAKTAENEPSTEASEEPTTASSETVAEETAEPAEAPTEESATQTSETTSTDNWTEPTLVPHLFSENVLMQIPSNWVHKTNSEDTEYGIITADAYAPPAGSTSRLLFTVIDMNTSAIASADNFERLIKGSSDDRVVEDFSRYNSDRANIYTAHYLDTDSSGASVYGRAFIFQVNNTICELEATTPYAVPENRIFAVAQEIVDGLIIGATDELKEKMQDLQDLVDWGDEYMKLTDEWIAAETDEERNAISEKKKNLHP